MRTIAILLLALIPVATGATTMDNILSAPRAYSGQRVELTGRVERPHAFRLRDGRPYVQFSLCATRCVRAFMLGSPAIAAGQTITVRGIYYDRKNVGGYVVRHGIAVDAGSL